MKYKNKCEICGSNKCELLFNQEDKNLNIPGKFSIFRCNNCGVLFINPQPTSSELEKHYSNGMYYSLNKIDTKSKKLNIKILLYKTYFDKKNKNIFLRLILNPLKFIARGTIIIPNSKLLDIGSGSGQFLYEMKKLGMDVQGIEPGDFNKKESEKYKLNIEKKDLIKYKAKKESFDIITMNHVLEHVHNPKEVVRKIHDLLKKNGILIIGVPNKNSLAYYIFGKNWHQLDVPRHLFNYSNKNIKSFVEKNGFKVLRVRYNSRPNQFVVGIYFLLGIKKRKGALNRILEGIFLPLTWLVNVLKMGDQIEVWCIKN